MFKYRFSLLALIMASTAVSAQPWEEKFFNPKKLDGDIVLPMPCEGSMVFRVIKTNTKKPLEDIKVTLGGNSNDEDGYAQYATPNYISGSFANEKQERYFLMGKYEVTEAQFNAVMKGEQCPSVNMKTSLPAINMSWFDAVEFTHKYNEWLLKNAADKQKLIIVFTRCSTFLLLINESVFVLPNSNHYKQFPIKSRFQTNIICQFDYRTRNI